MASPMTPPAHAPDFLASCGWQGADILPLAGDASFRRYFRVVDGARQAVLMDAPPPHEDVRPFIAVAEYLWIYERVSGWSEPRLANQLAQELLPRLLTARRNGEALRIARDRVRANPEFRPREGSDVVKLAQLARDAGDRPLARALLHDFDRRFPEGAARTSARTLLEQLTR